MHCGWLQTPIWNSESVRTSCQQPFQEQGIEFEFCFITIPFCGVWQQFKVASCQSFLSSKQSSNASSSKAFRKLIGRKVKYRKEKFSARIFDLFDVGVMAQLRMKLSEHEKKCQEWKDGGHLENPYMNQAHQVVILHSKIIARKTDSDGNQRVLQSWTPPNILEDEWILAKDVVPTKSVKLSSLSTSAKVQVSSQLYNYPSTLTTTRPKRGRKVRPHPRSTALSWHPDYLWLVPWEANNDFTAFL